MAKKDLRDATIYIRDGSTLESEILIGTGNITWTENTPMEYETEKGSIANGSVRKADEQPVEVSITAKWVDVTSEGSEDLTPWELVNAEGSASAAVSTGADACEPYACEIEIVFAVPCDTKDYESVKFNEFRAESVAFDPQAGTMVITGKSKEIRPTYARPNHPVNSVAPAITPTSGINVTETLTLANGTWSGGAFLSRQWYRNADGGDAAADVGNEAIAGATNSTYVLQPADEGYFIVAKVTYSSIYGTTTVLSNVTDQVDP